MKNILRECEFIYNLIKNRHLCENFNYFMAVLKKGNLMKYIFDQKYNSFSLFTV